MTFKTNVRKGREKLFALFVPIYGERALTKNVNLSTVETPVDIFL